MAWRLGLDMGTNSIGWAALSLGGDGEAETLVELGVRIFPDGREPQQSGRVGDSLAAARGQARSMRRNRDHGRNRRRHLMDCLIESGLMPADEGNRKELEKLDPYQLRARAATEVVEPHELGRALFHLGKRRGF